MFTAVAVLLARNGHVPYRATSAPENAAQLANPLNGPGLPIAEQEIARLNLSCAAGLAGAEQVDLDRCLGELEQMVAKVHSETERHLYRFRRVPAEFENSKSFLRC